MGMIGKIAGKSAFGAMFGTLKTIARHPFKTPARAFGVYKEGFTKIGSVLGGTAPITRQSMAEVGKYSARMLGTTAALTYAYRGVRATAGGPGIFKNRKGKRDIIPFMPFI